MVVLREASREMGVFPNLNRSEVSCVPQNSEHDKENQTEKETKEKDFAFTKHVFLSRESLK
jgi:hypothetical protein